MSYELNVLGVRFPLLPHAITEEPASKVNHIAYVQFAGSDVLKVGVWCKGGWHDQKRRPFAEPPIAWYSLEAPAHV